MLGLGLKDIGHEREHDYENGNGLTEKGTINQAVTGATKDLFKRAFRRFAAFLWIMPRLAALSMAEIIACTSFASGFAAAAEIPFCILRRRVRTLRLRSERTVVRRARLEADFVLAIYLRNAKNCERGGSRRGSHLSRLDALNRSAGRS